MVRVLSLFKTGHFDLVRKIVPMKYVEGLEMAR